jgi:hypothetical protein
MSADPNRKAWNSTLRPVALRKIGQPKPMRQRKKPLSLKEVTERFNIITAAALGEPRKIKAKKYRNAIKKRRALRPGEQSQVDFFKELAAKREFVSEISGEPLFELPDEPTEAEFKHWVSQFSHLLNKGHYKAYKKAEINIVFKTPEEHELWEKYKERVVDHCEPQYKAAWQRIVDRFIQLRNHANGITA